MVHIEKLSKAFGQASLLSNLSLSISNGDSASIMGPSGCGKSTLLNLLAGIESPDAGIIEVNGANIASMTSAEADQYRSTTLGIVFQQFHLLDCLNVWDNIAFTARFKGNYDSAYQRDLISQLGLSGLETKFIGQLSGGEQQRVAIARALNHRPALVLADEPTGNLDEKTSKIVSKLLFALCSARHTSLIVVTHSEQVAKQAQTHYRLHNGQLREMA